MAELTYGLCCRPALDSRCNESVGQGKTYAKQCASSNEKKRSATWSTINKDGWEHQRKARNAICEENVRRDLCTDFRRPLVLLTSLTTAYVFQSVSMTH
jgi:hypothetical protein